MARRRCSRCGEDKVCNPATGRCVSKTGRIGLSLLRGGVEQTVRPLTRKQAVAQVVASCTQDAAEKALREQLFQDARTLDDYLRYYRSVFGKKLYYLTDDVVRRCVGKKIVTVLQDDIDSIDCASTRGLDRLHAVLEEATVVDPDCAECENEHGVLRRRADGEVSDSWRYANETLANKRKRIVHRGSVAVLVFLNA